MKYTQATAALAGTLVALGSATPAFAQHEAHSAPGATQVAAGQARADEVNAQQLKQLKNLTDPQKFLSDVKANVDGLQAKEEAAARAVHPGGAGAVPAPAALLGGLTAGGGPIGVPLDSLA
ncbi:hypothetical protein ACFYVL_35820 [Streptomyces sp. NPDC004111]|uniref:hypothetical protein n=1 Tax=Streptomyces sp. NPDC004111 TaxID=3364690 RepID=UPI0036AA6D17